MKFQLYKGLKKCVFISIDMESNNDYVDIIRFHINISSESNNEHYDFAIQTVDGSKNW